MKIDKSKVIWDATSQEVRSLIGKCVLGFSKYDGSDAKTGILDGIDKRDAMVYHFLVMHGMTKRRVRFIAPYVETQLELKEATPHCVVPEQNVSVYGKNIEAWEPKFGELVLVHYFKGSYIRVFIRKESGGIVFVKPEGMKDFIDGKPDYGVMCWFGTTIEKINGTNLAPAPPKPKQHVPFDYESFKPHRERWIHNVKGMSYAYKIVSMHQTCVHTNYGLSNTDKFLSWQELADNWFFDDDDSPVSMEV